MAKVPRPVDHKRRRTSYDETEHQVPLTFVRIVHGKITKNHKQPKPLHALVDSGTSASIICKKQFHGNKSYQE